MTSLASKTSLYDMVSMVIPGYLLILCVQFVSGIKFNFDSEIAAAIVMFTLSWIIGLILHLVSKDIFDIVLRNRMKDLEDVNEEVRKSCDKVSESLNKNNKKVELDYYLRYYRQLPDYAKSVVPILEAQVAFLRSLLLVMLSFEYSILMSTQRNLHQESSYCFAVQYVILMVIVIGFLWGVSKYIKCTFNIGVSFVILLFIVFPLLVFSCLRYDIVAMEQSTMQLFNLIFYFLLIFGVAIFVLMYFRQRAIYKRIYEDDYYTQVVKRLNNIL